MNEFKVQINNLSANTYNFDSQYCNFTEIRNCNCNICNAGII